MDSLRLLEGERGRRRVSLDCTPPPEPGLAAEASERVLPSIEFVKGQVLVPIAMISKAVMRSLDVSDSGGASLPVANTAQNGEVAWAALCHALSQVTDPLPGQLVKSLAEIAQGAPAAAALQAEDLLSTGQVDGVQVFDPQAVPAAVGDLVRDLADNFLMLVLLPANDVGTRQILKYSFHWRSVPEANTTWLNRVLTAFGFSSAEYSLEAHGASWAASYHLEVHAPPGLTSTGLELPPREAGGAPAGQDLTVDPVAHVHGSYPDQPPLEPRARLQLAVPFPGLRATALLVSLFSAVIFVLEQVLPGAPEALRDAGDGAAALLLAAPAIVLALLSRSGENILEARLLFPLRAVVLGCALLLTAAAGSVVGQLHEPYFNLLWCLGAWSTSAATLLLLLAARLSAVRGRTPGSSVEGN
ncbi:hypothetical protein ACI792_04110 [Blastococcus sp. SYSU DS0669]